MSAFFDGKAQQAWSVTIKAIQDRDDECLPKSEHTKKYSPHNNQYTKGRKG